jgi:uncharacterized delta-60 repeat protein
MVRLRTERSRIRTIGMHTAAATLCAALLCASPPASATPTGALDPTFGDGGRVTTEFTLSGAPARADLQDLAIQPDGRIVAVGHNFRFIWVARYLLDGSLDPSFDGDGRVRITFGRAGADASAVAIDEDGNIVVGGTVHADAWSHLAVARLLPDGSLDTTFGGDGRVQVGFGPPGSRYLQGKTLTLESDGAISVGGWAEGCCPPRFAVARLLPDGSLDPSFGRNGHVTVAFHGDALMMDMASGPGGSLVGAGLDTNVGTGIVRLTDEGALDAFFGRAGRVTISFGGYSYAEAVAVDDVGRVVVCGISSYPTRPARIAVARLLPDGSLDPAFAGDGKLTIGMSNGASCRDLEVDGAGVWLAASTGDRSGLGTFGLLRLTEGGALDPSFGGDGMVTTRFADSVGLYAISIDPTGRPVLGGIEYGDVERFALARYAA